MDARSAVQIFPPNALVLSGNFWFFKKIFLLKSWRFEPKNYQLPNTWKEKLEKLSTQEFEKTNSSNENKSSELNLKISSLNFKLERLLTLYLDQDIVKIDLKIEKGKRMLDQQKSKIIIKDKRIYE